MNPKVSIIILNWNDLDYTVHCLGSLENITHPNYDIIVVDNGSKGNDAEILREKFKDYIHIIENDKNYGFAEGCNIGMRYALKNSAPDYILLLNNDTTVAPDFLAEMVKIAESDPLIGIAGPKIYFSDEPNKIQSVGGRINWCNGNLSLIGCLEIDKGQFDGMREVDWVSGCALLIKRTTIKDIGLLDPAYFRVMEEVDWCVRCKKSGYKVVFIPKAKIWHKGHFAPDEMSNVISYYTIRNQFLFMWKHARKSQSISFFIEFLFKKLLLPTIVALLRRHENLKTLSIYYRATYDGIRLIIRRNKSPE
jgi:GT2 family glycosyltransferase